MATSMRCYITFIILLIETSTLTLKAPSLHGNNSECGAKEINIKVSTDFINYLMKVIPINGSLLSRPVIDSSLTI